MESLLGLCLSLKSKAFLTLHHFSASKISSQPVAKIKVQSSIDFTSAKPIAKLMCDRFSDFGIATRPMVSILGLWDRFTAYRIAFRPMGLLLSLWDLFLAYCHDQSPKQF
ncbi:hypothetical protein M0802_014296 [Mischocyttarus mexicanus]|nr:hypothetical protein M0802_014296 [Mischocyttarus mexicanus]